MKNPTLPGYAHAERPFKAGGEKDLLASFRGDEGDHIGVAIERGEGRTFYLVVDRSGIGESRFSKQELGRVLETATALFQAL